MKIINVEETPGSAKNGEGTLGREMGPEKRGMEGKGEKGEGKRGDGDGKDEKEGR